MKIIILIIKTIIGGFAGYSLLILFVSLPYCNLQEMIIIVVITSTLCYITYIIFTKRDVITLKQFTDKLTNNLF